MAFENADDFGAGLCFSGSKEKEIPSKTNFSLWLNRQQTKASRQMAKSSEKKREIARRNSALCEPKQFQLQSNPVNSMDVVCQETVGLTDTVH